MKHLHASHIDRWLLSTATICLLATSALADTRDDGHAKPELSPVALFTDYEVVDLTVLLSEDLPGHWGLNPPFERWTFSWFAGTENVYGHNHPKNVGPFYAQRFIIDDHIGTQTDFPAHFIPPPESGLPHASEAGLMTGDKYPLEKMMGPAAVIDVTAKVDDAEPGHSARITVEDIEQWEKRHGAINAGDVVLFYSGYSDKYYKPMPEGLRMTFDVVVTKTSPGWPAPTAEVMDYLHGKGVYHMGTDGPSMGAAENGQIAHVAGLKYGMSWEEMLVGLGKLPARGAIYVALPLKIIDQSGSPTRAMAFVPRTP